MSVTARKFFYLANASPSNQCQALGGQYGYFYIYTYTPYTHPDGNPIDTNSGLGGTAVNETVDPQAGGTVCTNSTETGDGSLRSEGIFTDQVSLCSNSPIPTCDKKYTQVFKVAGYPVRTNTLEYTNTQLIYTNQGPTQ